MVHVKQWAVTPCSLAGGQQFLRKKVLPFHIHKFSVPIRTRGYRVGLKTNNVWLFVTREFETGRIS